MKDGSLSCATESMNYTIVAGRTYVSSRIKQKHKAKSKHTHNREILSEPSESTSKENQRHVFILSTKSSIHKSGISSALNTISYINLTPVAQISSVSQLRSDPGTEFGYNLQALAGA
ncbi:hypothetical protein BGAL_0202g00030 [Botrytis galanthina]|uniref:Uncharacterized protein n=1 Tax=Botrytis galanthina TaxID=278940 RepID=A0A4S8R008_9HELO|nr:hypothetical protein BGAL_0202g00030 [Botrytis galanthina]